VKYAPVGTWRGNLDASETSRNRIVRTFPCPICEAAEDEQCVYGRTTLGNAMRQATSHQGRYQLAAAAGVVPALPGDTWTF
jgi:hypothetical protein